MIASLAANLQIFQVLQKLRCFEGFNCKAEA